MGNTVYFSLKNTKAFLIVMYDKTNRFNTELIFFLRRLSPIHLLIQHENDQKKNKIKVEYKDEICKKLWPNLRDFMRLYFIYSFFTSMLKK